MKCLFFFDTFIDFAMKEIFVSEFPSNYAINLTLRAATRAIRWLNFQFFLLVIACLVRMIWLIWSLNKTRNIMKSKQMNFIVIFIGYAWWWCQINNDNSNHYFVKKNKHADNEIIIYIYIGEWSKEAYKTYLMIKFE